MRNIHFQLLSPWPDEALQFAGAVERAGRLILAARRGLSAGLGLTVPAWRLLKIVSQSRGNLRISWLARKLAEPECVMRALLLEEMTNDISLESLAATTAHLNRMSRRLRSAWIAH